MSDPILGTVTAVASVIMTTLIYIGYIAMRIADGSNALFQLAGGGSMVIMTAIMIWRGRFK